MTLEQYILMRKKEDSLNEYDLTKRSENIRTCVNYIFEYFDNYLENSPDSEKTILEGQKQDKYRKIVSKYSPEVQDCSSEPAPFSSSTQLYEEKLHIGLKSTLMQLCKVLQNENCIFAISETTTRNHCTNVRMISGRGRCSVSSMQTPKQGLLSSLQPPTIVALGRHCKTWCREADTASLRMGHVFDNWPSIESLKRRAESLGR